MKKYDLYKDSGIEWIGEIPKEWCVRKIKTVSNI
jgi:type I restriction enzyme S subunit